MDTWAMYNSDGLGYNPYDGEYPEGIAPYDYNRATNPQYNEAARWWYDNYYNKPRYYTPDEAMHRENYKWYEAYKAQHPDDNTQWPWSF